MLKQQKSENETGVANQNWDQPVDDDGVMNPGTPTGSDNMEDGEIVNLDDSSDEENQNAENISSPTKKSKNKLKSDLLKKSQSQMSLDSTIPANFAAIDEDRSYRICEINVNSKKGKCYLMLRIRQEAQDEEGKIVISAGDKDKSIDEIVVYESYDYFTVLKMLTDRPTVNKCFSRVRTDKQLFLGVC